MLYILYLYCALLLLYARMACICTMLIILLYRVGRALLTNQMLQVGTTKRAQSCFLPLYAAWERSGRQSPAPLKTLLKQLVLSFSAIC